MPSTPEGPGYRLIWVGRRSLGCGHGCFPGFHHVDDHLGGICCYRCGLVQAGFLLFHRVSLLGSI